MENTPQTVLPHRYPFLLVDRFLGLEGDVFHAVKNVSYNEPFFQGHFPGEPVMPGVLILEALAQAAGLGLAAREGFEGGEVGYLAGVDGARFRRPVVPGDVLHLHGEILSLRRGVCKVSAEARVEGDVAAEASLSFMYRV